jgi:N-acetylglutamate synthase-like GNAT family acetyltransferase
MNIVTLRKHTQHVPEPAQIYFDTWGYINPEETLADITAHLTAACASSVSAMPETFIAEESGVLLGAATLQQKTRLFPDIDWTPWLAGVYVKPAQRSRGIAPLLIREVESAASVAGYGKLYLCTHEHEAYYKRLGYETVEDRYFREEKTFVMTKHLD